MLLLTILVNYRKYEVSRTFVRSTSTFVNPVKIGILQSQWANLNLNDNWIVLRPFIAWVYLLFFVSVQVMCMIIL